MSHARNKKLAMLSLGIPLFLASAGCLAADGFRKEGEAAYASLLKNSALKIAAKALNDVIEQKISESNAVAAGRIQKEQEGWVAELYLEIESAPSAMRVPIALRMTQERTLAFITDNTAPSSTPVTETASLATERALGEDASREKKDALSLSSLHPKMADSEVSEFERKLQAAYKAIEGELEIQGTATSLNAGHSTTAQELLTAGVSLQNFLKSNPTKSIHLEAAGLSDLIARLHGYVILRAPEKRKASGLESQAHEYFVRKDFKKAAEHYTSALKLLEDMELALGTDFDVFERSEKGFPPGSLYTLIGESQILCADFKGCLSTVKKGLSVGQRIYKTSHCPWIGELNLLAARAYFEMRSYVMAELTVREAIKQLTSTENSNLKAAKSLFAMILNAGKK